MTNYSHPTIAREGWPFLAIALALAIGDKVSATTNILAVLQGK